MKINKNKLDVVLARRCMALTDLRDEIAPGTLVRINNSGELRTKTVGRLCKLLECDVSEIVEDGRS